MVGCLTLKKKKKKYYFALDLIYYIINLLNKIPKLLHIGNTSTPILLLHTQKLWHIDTAQSMASSLPEINIELDEI